MTETMGAASALRGGRRRAVGAEQSLVETSTPHGQVPLVVSPARAGVDLAGWAAANREQVEAWLLEHGAVYFHGFQISSPEAFESVAGALVPQLYGEYGDLPREATSSDKIFTSTPYPADESIHFHNESSHMARWPMRIFFYSALAAESGGETPVLDGRRVLADLPVDVVERFEQLGLLYVRNFTPGIDVSWQQFFGTSDRAEVESRCRESATLVEWSDDGERLRIRQPAAAVRRHPVTGDRVWFNQVLLHHPAALPAATRASMREMFNDDDLPRNVTFGDGSPIPDEVVEQLLDLFARTGIAFEWTSGDILAVDNMLVGHGRLPFSGPRKTLVAMGALTDG